MDPKSKDELDNRSNQLNPNNDAYHSSRSDDDDDDDDNDSSETYIDENDSETFQEEWIPNDAL